ncbi:kinase-like protein [Exidia glandulosa HHB12029]|uniref:Kinase-like protein n=1 Tax=Exidia glandulosa HHB12029 TaxID=1314781 RepID=A0A165J918_EXIGL|nr:kinase-like protein [Exidia glandulosa HHB12029]
MSFFTVKPPISVSFSRASEPQQRGDLTAFEHAVPAGTDDGEEVLPPVTPLPNIPPADRPPPYRKIKLCDLMLYTDHGAADTAENSPLLTFWNVEVKNLADEEMVALKVIRLRNQAAPAKLGLSTRDADALRTHWREIALWLKLDHPNIHPLLGLYWDLFDYPALVSPWSENGDVMSYIKPRRGHPRLHTIKLDLIENIMRGLVYLHHQSPPVIHGDLKGANVLVSCEGIARIADFGVSRIAYDAIVGPSTSSAKGTYRWMAPELLATDDAQNTIENDMWSAGCLMLEISTEVHPYNDKPDEMQVILALGRNEVPWIPRTSSVDAVYSQLIDACLAMNPSERPRAFVMHHRVQNAHYYASSALGENDSDADPVDLTFDVQLTSPEEVIVRSRVIIRFGTRNDSSDVQKVGLKRIRVPSSSADEERRLRERMWLEFKTWNGLRHDNILPLLGLYWEWDQDPAAVFVWCRNGSMSEFLRTRRKSEPAVEFRFKEKLIGGVLLGINYIHKLGIVHGDIRPENILIGNHEEALLAGFGRMGKNVRCTRHLDLDCLRYTAPELVSEEDHYYTCASDVWSLGCVILEILTDVPVYNGYQVRKHLLGALRRGVLPRDIETVLKDSAYVRYIRSLEWHGPHGTQAAISIEYPRVCIVMNPADRRSLRVLVSADSISELMSAEKWQSSREKRRRSYHGFNAAFS